MNQIIRALLAVAFLLGGGTAVLGQADGGQTIVRFQHRGTTAYGVVESDSVRELTGSFGGWRPTEQRRALRDVELLVPTEPTKIIAMSGNRPRNGRETTFEPFYKVPSALVAGGGAIVIPEGYDTVKAEAELVIVIGRRASRVPVEKAHEYVLGLTVGNDVGLSAWQEEDEHFWRAKSADTFAPVAPYVATDIDGRDVTLELRVNGRARDRTSAGELVFGVPEIVSRLSQAVTLEPGDLIFAGTAGRSVRVGAGDVVEVVAEGIGTLRNPVVSPGVPGPVRTGDVRRLLLAAAEGRGRGVKVYDVGRNFALVGIVDYGSGDAKGIAASAANDLLFLSGKHTDEVVAYDLARDRVVWRRRYGPYPDRLAVTPDGEILYVPLRRAGEWVAVEAATGRELGRLKVPAQPHNTLSSADGRWMYLASLGDPVLSVADTRTHRIVRRLGLFSAGIRPFTVDPARGRVYVNVDGLLGFEVGDLRTGRMLHRVEVPGFEPPRSSYHNTPSHGIGLTPDGREVWVVNASGYLHIFDATGARPRHVADIAVNGDPGWISFSIDGRLAYSATGDIIDTATREVVARVGPSEKMLEVHLDEHGVVRVGNQFGVPDDGILPQPQP